MKEKRNLMPALMLIVGALTVQNANAIPVMWAVEGVTFNDGGTIRGSFVFDAQTGAYSNIKLVSTATVLFSGASYGGPLFNYSSSIFQLRSMSDQMTLAGDTAVFLNWASVLTDAGGTTAVVPYIAQSANSFEGVIGFRGAPRVDRYVTDGGTVSSVPEPATIVLIALGTAGILLRRRLTNRPLEA